jgi:hypothetical protein
VNFPVSCNAPAQQEFNRAMALFHSFWFDPAKASFGQELQHDPSCGMAHWGVAIMSMGNSFTWATNPNASKAGAPAAAEAARVGAQSARERDYIAALQAFFKGLGDDRVPAARCRVRKGHASGRGEASGSVAPSVACMLIIP